MILTTRSLWHWWSMYGNCKNDFRNRAWQALKQVPRQLRNNSMKIALSVQNHHLYKITQKLACFLNSVHSVVFPPYFYRKTLPESLVKMKNYSSFVMAVTIFYFSCIELWHKAPFLFLQKGHPYKTSAALRGTGVKNRRKIAEVLNGCPRIMNTANLTTKLTTKLIPISCNSRDKFHCSDNINSSYITMSSLESKNENNRCIKTQFSVRYIQNFDHAWH